MTNQGEARLVRELLAFALELAVEAGDLTLRHFGFMLDHEDKADGSPVTRADREAEALIQKRIAHRFPAHGYLGEELGERNEGAGVRWIVDPIDGTLSFMRGVPLYAVLIGVEIEGAASVGVAHFPAVRETVAAGRGLGCTLNGEPCRVSEVGSLASAVVCATDENALAGSRVEAGWQRLRRRCALSRTWGDAYGHALVATGRVEVQVDPILNPWDAAPLLPIISEAGGRFTTLEGEATIHGGSGVGTNGLLHDEVLEILGSTGRRR